MKLNSTKTPYLAILTKPKWNPNVSEFLSVFGYVDSILTMVSDVQNPQFSVSVPDPALIHTISIPQRKKFHIFLMLTGVKKI